MFRADNETVATLAAAYVRMSTEHQQYSTSNQMDIIKDYAQRRGMQIVKQYSDEGKSGLNIRGRDSLAQMIKDEQWVSEKSSSHRHRESAGQRIPAFFEPSGKGSMPVLSKHR